MCEDCYYYSTVVLKIAPLDIFLEAFHESLSLANLYLKGGLSE